jgi:hypothetical protein
MADYKLGLLVHLFWYGRQDMLLVVFDHMAAVHQCLLNPEYILHRTREDKIAAWHFSGRILPNISDKR